MGKIKGLPEWLEKEKEKVKRELESLIPEYKEEL